MMIASASDHVWFVGTTKFKSIAAIFCGAIHTWPMAMLITTVTSRAAASTGSVAFRFMRECNRLSLMLDFARV